jgi:hypothetical protein
MQNLTEKWGDLLNSSKADTIKDDYRKQVTAQLLENQERFLQEAATSTTGSIDNWDTRLISLVRRMAPKLIAYEICGVQPMSGPTGLIFAQRARYAKQLPSSITRNGTTSHQFDGNEAFMDESNSAYSGTGIMAGVDPFTPAGTIGDVIISNSGAGYTGSTTVTITGDGTGATAIPVIGQGALSGRVTGVIITNPGTGYTEATVTINDASGTGAGGSVLIGGVTTGTGMGTGAGETADSWNSMSMTIEKVTAEAVTRQLRADYSLEIAQDLRAVHGLDAETELSNILSTELITEINREIVRTLYNVAKIGAQFSGQKGVFDLQYDADGRWSVERFKGLLFAIERDANAIAYDTRRGKGNIIVTSADVASALVMAGVLEYNPELRQDTSLAVDVAGAAYAGVMGRYRVFVDPYLSVDGYMVGYKGTSAYDAGAFYCPYVPLQMVRAQDTATFQPAIGFKTRYAIVANPFTSNNANSNVYYRKTKVKNIL